MTAWLFTEIGLKFTYITFGAQNYFVLISLKCQMGKRLVNGCKLHMACLLDIVPYDFNSQAVTAYTPPIKGNFINKINLLLYIVYKLLWRVF